mmetsp:Transcript_4398/g.10426  ORF Transcript_4398/g.10426 Transcript_4398/m.10426 type:complete len:139 (-) Transcript_4398:261-677(-)
MAKLEEEQEGVRRRRGHFFNQDMADHMKEAAEARQDFARMVTFSDIWLLGTIIFFSILGNVRRVKSHSEVYFGIFLFCCSFGVYLLIKEWERRNEEEWKRQEAEEEEWFRQEEEDRLAAAAAAAALPMLMTQMSLVVR